MICRVSAVFLVVLLGAGRIAAAQDVPKHPGGAPRPPPPIVVPQELSPPQEAYAAFPDAPAAAAAPSAPSACQLRLAKLAVFQPLPVLVGPGECGATDAVLLQTVILPDQTKVPLSPAATLRCPMAEQVAQWIRDDVAPSVKKLGPPISGLDNYDSYECRGRNRVRGAKLSEHGRANALDVRGVKLADGRTLGLTDIRVDKDWRDGMRASACARFSTILGPGSDGAHEEHIHLDLAERRNNYKVCEWDVRVPVVQAKAAPPADDAAAPADDATAQGEDAEPLPLETVPLPRRRPRAADAVGSEAGYPSKNTDRN
jgi:hypothetical protein